MAAEGNLTPCLEVAPSSADPSVAVTLSSHLSGSRKRDFNALVYASSLLVAVVAGGGSTNAGWLGRWRWFLVRRTMSVVGSCTPLGTTFHVYFTVFYYSSQNFLGSIASVNLLRQVVLIP